MAKQPRTFTLFLYYEPQLAMAVGVTTLGRLRELLPGLIKRVADVVPEPAMVHLIARDLWDGKNVCYPELGLLCILGTSNLVYYLPDVVEGVEA